VKGGAKRSDQDTEFTLALPEIRLHRSSHPIPVDLSYYGVGAILDEETNKRTVDLIQTVAKNAEPGSDAQKVGDYYASFMDEAGIESKGITPLQSMFAKIAAIGDRTALARYLGEGLRADIDILNATDLYTDNLFGLWVSPSFQDPTRYSPFLFTRRPRHAGPRVGRRPTTHDGFEVDDIAVGAIQEILSASASLSNFAASSLLTRRASHQP
jgi:hypothetical protein